MESSPEQSEGIRIVKRLGSTPAERGHVPDPGPAAFELESGDVAFKGIDLSDEVALPSDAGIAPTERMVLVPRQLLLAALEQLPDETRTELEAALADDDRPQAD